MARSNFGGNDTTALAIAAPSGNSGVVRSAPNISTGTAWSAATGGSQHTDLILPGGGACLVRTDADGFVRAMQGPDGVNEGMWIDLGAGSRFWLRTVDSLSTHILTVGNATYAGLRIGLAPSLRVKHAKVSKIISTFQTGHAWTAGGGPWNLNDTSIVGYGSQVASHSSYGAGGEFRLVSPNPLAAIDVTGKLFEIALWFDNVANLASIALRVGNGPVSAYTEYTALPNGGSHRLVSGAWNLVRFSKVQQTSVVGSPPADTAITGMQVVIKDKGGSNILFCAVGRLALIDNTDYPAGVISFTFDDGYDSTWTEGRKKLSQYGYPAASAVIVDRVGQSGYLTLAQLHALQDSYGWDVIAHAYTVAMHNVNVTTVTTAALETELAALKSWLADEGFAGADQYVYPGGIWNTTVEAQVARYFGTARNLALAPRNVFPEPHPLRIGSDQPTGGQSAASVTARIGTDMAAGNWLNLCWHKITPTVVNATTDYTIAGFATIVDYIAAQGYAVKTPGEILGTR